MSVRLRLRRVGARHQPRYRIVAADARSPRDGRFIEVVGHYDPTRQPHEVVIHADLAQKWLKRGAQPTETVRDLLVQQGILAKPVEARAQRAPEPLAAQPPEPAAVQPEREAPAADVEAPGPEEPSGETAASA